VIISPSGAGIQKKGRDSGHSNSTVLKPDIDNEPGASEKKLKEPQDDEFLAETVILTLPDRGQRKDKGEGNG
jgi:hypothetical protein